VTVLNPRRFPDRIVRRRQASGYRNDLGVWVPGAVTETELLASVQPLDLSAAALESGSPLQERLKVYVPEPGALAAAFDDRGADRVRYAGAEYTVIESRSWPGGHTRATLLRQT